MKLPRGYYKAFVELHIEQGPLLERQQIPLGIVTKIAAPASLRILIEGAGGHAGGVLMPDRHDALCAAAELILAIENSARTSGAIDTVATVGICDVFPGAVNSIPSRVRLSVDIRDTDLQRRDRVMRAIETTCESISAQAAGIDPQRVAERRRARGLRSRNHRSAFSILPQARTELPSHGQPRLSRLTFHVAHRSGRHVVHSLPQRIQPPS